MRRRLTILTSGSGCHQQTMSLHLRGTQGRSIPSCSILQPSIQHCREAILCWRTSATTVSPLYLDLRVRCIVNNSTRRHESKRQNSKIKRIVATMSLNSTVPVVAWTIVNLMVSSTLGTYWTAPGPSLKSCLSKGGSQDHSNAGIARTYQSNLRRACS